MIPEERIFEIVRGDKTFPLTQAYGDDYISSPLSGGLDPLSIVPHSHDQRTFQLEDRLITESWNLALGGLDADQVDRVVADFIAMLRDAFLYSRSDRDRREPPVYIIQRAARESKARYAPVRECPTLRLPPAMFNLAFEQECLINGAGVSLARYAWREGAPQDVGSPITLEKTDAPANNTVIQIANVQHNDEIDTIFVYDSSATAYSANQAGVAHDMFPDPMGVGDIYYVGSDTPHYHFAQIIQAMEMTAPTAVAEYWNGAWVTLPWSSNWSFYPTDYWSRDPGDEVGWNYVPPEDWASTAVNGVTKFWIRIRVTGVSASVTTMINVKLYTPKTPELRIPATAFDGDISPLTLLRLRHQYGVGTTPQWFKTSRVIVGLKTQDDRFDLDEFSSHLNIANANNPPGWAIALGDDASIPNTPYGVNNECGAVDFATDSTMAMRFRFTGTAKLLPYTGEYKVFAVCTCTTGYNAGEIKFKLVTKIDGTGNDAPAIHYPEVSPQFDAASVSFELIDLIPDSIIRVPFLDTYYGDDYENADLIFEIWAERLTGSATFYPYKLIFIPADEWIADLNDPVINTTLGTSALRLDTLLDVDSGIIGIRTHKQRIQPNGSLVPAERWGRRSKPMMIEPRRAARLYFLLGCYTGTWGGTQMEAPPGGHLTAELYHQDRFLYLRGDRS